MTGTLSILRNRGKRLVAPRIISDVELSWRPDTPCIACAGTMRVAELGNPRFTGISADGIHLEGTEERNGYTCYVQEWFFRPGERNG